MASNLLAMASNLEAMASNLLAMKPHPASALLEALDPCRLHVCSMLLLQCLQPNGLRCCSLLFQSLHPCSLPAPQASQLWRQLISQRLLPRRRRRASASAFSCASSPTRLLAFACPSCSFLPFFIDLELCYTPASSWSLSSIFGCFLSLFLAERQKGSKRSTKGKGALRLRSVIWIYSVYIYIYMQHI